MSRTCPHCSSSEIDEDPSRGDSTCMSCGIVLEESRIVAEVQFLETAGGGHQVSGQFVSQDRVTLGTGGAGQPKPESREVTYLKGRKLLQEIASQLRINQHCTDTAYAFFKLCVNSNYTRGRVRSHVVVACLYMTCRLEGTPHLLLDFSDITQVNVFDLGRTLNFLTRSLKINLPTTDPCLYVLRFAIMLDFGEKQRDIVSLATRIVQRMKRDWIATGRRPTGICGAALLLAARAFNVNRAVSDIVKVVHISETVVRKRLDEFGQTDSGNLTIDEFNVVDLENCADPPAYQESRRRLRESKRLEEELQKADQVTKDFNHVHEELESALRDKMKRSAYGALLIGQSKDNDVPELQQARIQVQSELIEEIYTVADQLNDTMTEKEKSFQEKLANYGPTFRSLGLDREPPSCSVPQPSTSHQHENREEDPELHYDDLDDDEIDAYILSEQEVKMKTELWMVRNGIHMEELEKRRRIKLEEEEREAANPKKKRRVVPKQPINASNVNDAMLQVIQEKKLSNKINYAILKELDSKRSGELRTLETTQPVVLPVIIPPAVTAPIVAPIISAPATASMITPASVIKSPVRKMIMSPPISPRPKRNLSPMKSPLRSAPLSKENETSPIKQQTSVSSATVKTKIQQPQQSRYKHKKILPTAAMRAKK